MSGVAAQANLKETVISAAGALSSHNNMSMISTLGAYTLPPIAGNTSVTPNLPSLVDGYVLWLKNTSGGSATVTAAGTDVLEGTPVTLTTGQACSLMVFRNTSGAPYQWKLLVKAQ